MPKPKTDDCSPPAQVPWRAKAGQSSSASAKKAKQEGWRERERGAADFQTEASRSRPAHLLQTGSSRFSSTQKFVPFSEEFQESRTFDPGGGVEMPERAQAPDLKRLGEAGACDRPQSKKEETTAEHPRAPCLLAQGQLWAHRVLTQEW